MTSLAVLTAVVLVLQLTGTTIRIPFLSTSVSLVLIPITLGAILLGPLAGAFLGFVFGAVVYVSGGVLGMDPFTLLLFQQHPIITAGICLLKSTLAGFLAGLAYRLLCPRKEVNTEESKNNAFGKISRSLLAVFVAAAVTPIVNTGIFILGCYVKIAQRLAQNSSPETPETAMAIGVAMKNERFKSTIKHLSAMLFSFFRSSNKWLNASF